MTKLKPRNGNVILKKIEEDELMVGNIILPDIGSEKPIMGEVLAVSQVYNYNKGEYVPTDLKIGQRVVLPPMGAHKVKLEGEEYLIVNQNDILSIIE